MVICFSVSSGLNSVLVAKIQDERLFIFPIGEICSAHLVFIKSGFRRGMGMLNLGRWRSYSSSSIFIPV